MDTFLLFLKFWLKVDYCDTGYYINFVNKTQLQWLWRVDGFLWVLGFPLDNKTDCYNKTEILLKVVLSIIYLTSYNNQRLPIENPCRTSILLVQVKNGKKGPQHLLTQDFFLSLTFKLQKCSCVFNYM